MEASLVAALEVPALRPSAIAILANLHTPGSQRALVEIAGEGMQPLADRQAAAAAFAKNVAHCGTLLTTAEIMAQYNRYNASEREEKPVQKVLGSILDTIETYARKHRAG
jgi:hypothetical protein